MGNQHTEFEQVAVLSWLFAFHMHPIKDLTPAFPLFSPPTSGPFHLMASYLEIPTCEFIMSEEG